MAIITLAFVGLVVIGLIVGIKEGVVDRKSSESRYLQSLAHSSLIAEKTSPPPSSLLPSNMSATSVLLDDTSIAAAVTLNGDRNLFFQDHTGAIRQVTRDASKSIWVELGSPVPSGAKLHTPLAIVYSVVGGKDDVSGPH